MKASVNTRNGNGLIDLTDEERAKRAAKVRVNRALPSKGMKYFPEYGVYAINEKNAKRKSKVITISKHITTNSFSNLYRRIIANFHTRKADKVTL